MGTCCAQWRTHRSLFRLKEFLGGDEKRRKFFCAQSDEDKAVLTHSSRLRGNWGKHTDKAEALLRAVGFLDGQKDDDKGKNEWEETPPSGANGHDGHCRWSEKTHSHTLRASRFWGFRQWGKRSGRTFGLAQPKIFGAFYFLNWRPMLLMMSVWVFVWSCLGWATVCFWGSFWSLEKMKFFDIFHRNFCQIKKNYSNLLYLFW